MATRTNHLRLSSLRVCTGSSKTKLTTLTKKKRFTAEMSGNGEWQDSFQKAKAMVDQMTLEEKVTKPALVGLLT